MSLLSTPPFFIFSKTPTKSLHHHSLYTSSFSLLPSSTPPLSSSSTTFFSATRFTFTPDGDDDDDEWGQEPKSKPKPKQKPKSKSNSFTVGPPGLSVSFTVPDEWGEKSGPEPEPDVEDEWGQEPKPDSKPKSFSVGTPDLNVSVSLPDEWGEKSGPDPEPESRFTGPDPPIREDEDSWGPQLPTIGSVESAIKSGVEKVVDSVDDGVGQVVDSVEDSVEQVVDSVDDSVEQVVDGVEGGVEGAVDGVEQVVDGVEDGVDSAIDEVEGALENVIDSVDGGRRKKSMNLELKRALLDSLYGTELGFRASAEVRAELSELVSRLEASNPNPSPTEVPGLLDGNWILVYTAFSELLPLLAVGATPLLKVQQISQAINTMNQTVENSTILSTPFATFTFSATASFDVRSSSRIQVQFKEATFKPPEIKSRFDLPANIDLFGQNITLSPVQQLLNPVQEAAASISRALYGLPPLKIPISGERPASWLLFTYVDEDFRISRGDGGIFVLVREGSPLLDQ